MTDLLKIRVDGQEVAVIRASEVPCEITPDVPLHQAAQVAFEEPGGAIHRHVVPARKGWLHLSVRVHANLACQADAVVTQRPVHQAGTPLGEGDVGVRFQPFFLAGASHPPNLTGQGLFARGLHFVGSITPSNIFLSCECDACRRSFLVRSFHAGMGGQAYFYSASGGYTLILDGHEHGAPVPLAQPDEAALRALEASLPVAPDGSSFSYYNPFRCPHCAAPYIDFTAHPERREGEYYGLYLADRLPLRYTRDDASAPG